jgi:DNA-directed RNA polymerase specialized sigma24 family protein
MEQACNNIQSVSALSIPTTYNNDLTVAEEKIKKHESLLHKIALCFGFSQLEAWELVQQVCLQAYKNYTNEKICFPLRVSLTKDIVHQCIFKISRQLFSQYNIDEAEIKLNVLNDHSAYISPGRFYLQKMPLRYRAIYILSIMFPFNEIEVAEILNITPSKVKERLQKTLAFIKDH